ncbi:MAG: hypothetical protein NVS4B10_15030 [Myxococcales bacterium]
MGGAGTWVSTTKVAVTLALAFRAASFCETATVWAPSANALSPAQLHRPPAETGAWQTIDPASATETVAPGSPVPWKAGRVAAVGLARGATVGGAIDVLTT